MLINTDFFVGEISVANSGTGGSLDVNQKLEVLITKYEPKCLEGIMGYELYKDFIANINEQRMQDIINGVEYTSVNGSLAKWRGLVYTNTGYPAQPVIVGYTQRPSEDVQVDHTTGLVSGTNTFTFDGEDGKPDWRGYKLIVTRVGYDTMIEGFDYSFNQTTGLFTLLKAGDVFAADSWFNVIFNPNPVATYPFVIGGTVYFSLIAQYIYYWYLHDQAIWNSGIGTVIPKTDTVINNPPTMKMNKAFNEFARQGRELAYFLYATKDTYPEFGKYSVQTNAITFTRTINDFDI